MKNIFLTAVFVSFLFVLMLCVGQITGHIIIATEPLSVEQVSGVQASVYRDPFAEIIARETE